MAIQKANKPAPVQRTVKVWGSVSMTLNLGEYESLKVEIGEEVQVENCTHEEATALLARNLRAAGEEAVTEIIGSIPLVEKGMKPAGVVAIHFKNLAGESK